MESHCMMTNWAVHRVMCLFPPRAYKNMGNLDMYIGNYRLLRLLDEGRYTEVWLGEHIDLKKEVVVKILIPQKLGRSNERLCIKKRFHREARILAQLDHPHIVQVFDYGEEYGLAYFVMEYAPYGSLAQRHRLGERLPLPIVRSYASQVRRAIHYIRIHALIQRDIKPQNTHLRTT